MIKATINHYHHHVSSFTITGHADAGEYGQDIVCSAVSVLSITTVNGLQEVAGMDVDVDSDDKMAVICRFIFPSPPIQRNVFKQMQFLIPFKAA